MHKALLIRVNVTNQILGIVYNHPACSELTSGIYISVFFAFLHECILHKTHILEVIPVSINLLPSALAKYTLRVCKICFFLVNKHFILNHLAISCIRCRWFKEITLAIDHGNSAGKSSVSFEIISVSQCIGVMISFFIEQEPAIEFPLRGGYFLPSGFLHDPASSRTKIVHSVSSPRTAVPYLFPGCSCSGFCYIILFLFISDNAILINTAILICQIIFAICGFLHSLLKNIAILIDQIGIFRIFMSVKICYNNAMNHKLSNLTAVQLTGIIIFPLLTGCSCKTLPSITVHLSWNFLICFCRLEVVLCSYSVYGQSNIPCTWCSILIQTIILIIDLIISCICIICLGGFIQLCSG